MDTRGTAFHFAIGAVILLVAIAGCLDFMGDGEDGMDGNQTDDEEVPDYAQATLATQDGDDAGTVTFVPVEEGTRVLANVGNLSTGFHGFHIHENGTCEPEFTAAGGHFAPDGNDHGDHAGDMPVLHVNDDGSGTHAFTTDRFTLEDLLADNGTALVIHEGPDNYANIPDRYGGPDEDTLAAGDAGPREACGAIEGLQEEDIDPEIDMATADATANLADMDGNDVGTVSFVGQDGAVRVQADVEGLSPGFHGFHVHENGVCDPDFSLAGGHYAPNDNDHGDHPGDMPVLLVTENQTAELSFTTDRFGVTEVTELDGTAVIVHAGPDNYANIPDRYGGPDDETNGAGDAGARVACGVVEAEGGLGER